MTDEDRRLQGETHDAVIRIEANCLTCRATTEKHDRTLYGNGVVGLVSKVHLLMWLLGVASVIGAGLVIKAVAFGG